MFSKGWQSCSEGFLEGKARGQSQGAALPARGKPVLPDSFTQITCYNLYVSVLTLLKCTDGSVLAFLKSRDGSVLELLKFTDGSVLALLKLPSIFSSYNSTFGEFWCTMAIMQ